MVHGKGFWRHHNEAIVIISEFFSHPDTCIVGPKLLTKHCDEQHQRNKPPIPTKNRDDSFDAGGSIEGDDHLSMRMQGINNAVA